MNATNLDWLIAGLFLVFLTVGGVFCRRFIRSVADWTVAGRHMRKYLGLSSGSAEGIGIATVAAMLEPGFKTGLSYIGV